MASTATQPQQAVIPPKVTVKADDMKTVIDSMRDVSSEASRWELADALSSAIPTGPIGFEAIVKKAEEAGVLGNLSANTLRWYRDTAKIWPKSKRVPNVSFTAHREVERLKDKNGNFNSVLAVKTLKDVQDKHGKVSVTEVRKAVRLLQKPKGANNQKRGGTPAPNPVVAAVDILLDIKAGSPKLIKSIGPNTTKADLDKLKSGLSKALGHVEALQQRQATKAAPTAKAAAPATPKASAPATNGQRRQRKGMKV